MFVPVAAARPVSLTCFFTVCCSPVGVFVSRVSRGSCSAFCRVFCGVRVGVCCGRSWLRLGGEASARDGRCCLVGGVDC